MTVSSNSSSGAPIERIASPGKVWTTGLIAAVLSSIGNLLVWFISAQAFNVPYNLQMAGMQNSPPFPFLVVTATFIGVLGGTLLFSLLPRVTKRPITVFRIVAIVVLLISFAQPALLLTSFSPMVGPVETSTVIALEIMHVVAGVITIGLLTTRARA